MDASVTAAWLLPDQASEHTRKLYAAIRRDEVEPQAPNAWQWECANILANGVRSGRIPPAAVEGLWSVLDAVRHRVELHELAPAQHKAVLAVAVDAGVSQYDAGYLWLARRSTSRSPPSTSNSSRPRRKRASGCSTFQRSESPPCNTTRSSSSTSARRSRS
jgi:predicted nucleic acid-binding protein